MNAPATIGTPPASPTCPVCEGDMKLRSAKGRPFWGCKAYPKCTGTIDAADKSFLSERTPTPSDGSAERRWRRETAVKVLLKILEHPEYWNDDTRPAGVVAVQLVDELNGALR